MKKIDRRLIMAFFIILFFFAPIEEGYRYFFLACIPFYIAILNVIILKNQILSNIDNEKFKMLEKNYGTKKAFFLYVLLLVLIPVLLGLLFIFSGLKLLY